MKYEMQVTCSAPFISVIVDVPEGEEPGMYLDRYLDEHEDEICSELSDEWGAIPYEPEMSDYFEVRKEA